MCIDVAEAPLFSSSLHTVQTSPSSVFSPALISLYIDTTAVIKRGMADTTALALQSRFPRVLSRTANADAYGGYVTVSTTGLNGGRPMELRVSARVVPCCSDDDDDDDDDGDDEDEDEKRREKNNEEKEEKKEEPNGIGASKRQEHVQWEVMAVPDALVSPLVLPPTTWSAAFSKDARGGAVGRARLCDALESFVRSAEEPSTQRHGETEIATADVCSILGQLDIIGWANVSGIANGFNAITLEKKYGARYLAISRVAVRCVLCRCSLLCDPRVSMLAGCVMRRGDSSAEHEF